MKYLFSSILDVLFPRTQQEKQLDKIDKEYLHNNCLKTIHDDKRFVVIFSYEDSIIKQAIWSLKFRRRKRFAKIFGEILYDEILENLSELDLFSNFKQPILVPIPLSKKRLRERGFNQCELIAKEMQKIDMSNSFTLEKDILIKTKDTPHQSRARNKKERLENLKNSFSVKNHQKIKGKNIILLDDVTTTGTTLKEASRILKRAGAKKIIYLTIAH